MLPKGRLVHDVLLLILVGVAKFSLDVIHKNSRNSHVYPQEDFKVGLDRRYQNISSNLLLILLPRFKAYFLRNITAKDFELQPEEPDVAKSSLYCWMKL